MVSFLLIISFLLHLITLAVILQLVKKLQKIENEPESKEVALALERSLDEIKQENDRLQALLDKSALASSRKEKEPRVEPKTSSKSEYIPIAEKEDSDHGLDKLLSAGPTYKVEASLESRVMQLYQEGLSIEEIAKRLDCGKTEAELIIKLYNK